jgi:hypothetical protein
VPLRQPRRSRDRRARGNTPSRSWEEEHRWRTVSFPRSPQHRKSDERERWSDLDVKVLPLGGMFLLGFVRGSVRQRSVQAHVPGLGGALGSVPECGSSLGEMQQHGDGLQQNRATLKKVQAALGGGP